MSGGSFSLQLREFVEQTGRNAEEVLRQSSLSLLNAIILRSPVDTGRFRGNWQVSLFTPLNDEIDVTDKTGAATLEKGKAVLASLAVGETIWLSNGLPYGIELEFHAHSKQAPNGMVRLALREYRRYLERAAQALPK